MSLRIVDQPARGNQYLVLNVRTTGLFSQFISAHHLPIIQPAQEYQHANANEQEDEHLPTACTAQFYAHPIPPFKFSWLNAGIIFWITSRCFTTNTCRVFGSAGTSPRDFAR